MVEAEVIANITHIAEMLFEKDAYNWEEWANVLYTECPECGAENSFAMDDERGWYCKECGLEVDEPPEDKMRDILEYWLVSPWLGKKLRGKGEPVYPSDGSWVWGRRTTGQALWLDEVIIEIARG